MGESWSCWEQPATLTKDLAQVFTHTPPIKGILSSHHTYILLNALSEGFKGC